MTLPFKTHIDKKPTYFVEKIWAGLANNGHAIDSFDLSNIDFDFHWYFYGAQKIHTIRSDPKNRWKVNMPIHFVINNRTPKRFQFAPVLPVKAIQTIKIISSKEEVWINGRLLDFHLIPTLSRNDGFETVHDFFEYFKEDFERKIIHWTKFVYYT